VIILTIAALLLVAGLIGYLFNRKASPFGARTLLVASVVLALLTVLFGSVMPFVNLK